MNNRVVSEWASECNEWITEWMTMNVACLPRTVHTRIEFPKEHVFNFHARIILNGGKTVERDNKTGKKRNTCNKNNIVVILLYSQQQQVWTVDIAQWHWPCGPLPFHLCPCQPPPPWEAIHRWAAAAAAVALHFLVAVVYFRKVIPNWLSDWPAAIKNETTKYIKIVHE